MNIRFERNVPFPMFPMFVRLDGKRVLIVGGGKVAARKAEVLLKCGASLLVVAPNICKELEMLGCSFNVRLIRRKYTTGDVADADMIIAATNDREVNRLISLDAGGIPINVVDCRAECSFFFPAFVEHDGFVAGVSSSGRAPEKCRALAEKLRECWKDWVKDVWR